MNRCTWVGEDSLMIRYHDEEWGRPTHEEDKLFEFLVLGAFQAGLSWRTILRRREGFRKAFKNFDAQKVARFNAKDLSRLLLDESIIRNRLKIAGSITNAQRFLEIQDEFGSFDRYIWQFTNRKSINNTWKSDQKVPASTPLSDEMSTDLKKRGFKFVGTTICYAFMQTIGMVNDHLVTCACHKKYLKLI